MIKLFPFNVPYTLGFPRISRRFCAASFPPDPWVFGMGIRNTWLARNSSDVMEASNGAPVSASRALSRTSAVGTRRMCCCGGRHWARMGLLEKALRNGFRGCIHSTGFATALNMKASLRVWPPLGGFSGTEPCSGLCAGAQTERRYVQCRIDGEVGIRLLERGRNKWYGRGGNVIGFYRTDGDVW